MLNRTIVHTDTERGIFMTVHYFDGKFWGCATLGDASAQTGGKTTLTDALKDLRRQSARLTPD